MKILVFLALVSVSLARPDVGLGYHYQPPATSYGVPSGSIQGVNDQKYYHHVQHSENFAPISTPSRSFEAPIREHSSFTGSTSSGPQISGTAQFSQGQFNQGQAPSVIGVGGTRYENTGSSSTGSSAFGTPQQSYQSTSSSAFGTSFGTSGGAASGGNLEQRFRGDQVEVQKHLYFYTAPEEPEEVKTRINIPVAPPKKNVKIIFIKAPTYRAPQIQIPIQQQNLEKTVVYVLVKKPEDIQDIQLPEQPALPPSKPEVFFIKYKNQHDAEQAISQVQQGAQALNGLSVHANTVDGDRDFISNIGQDASGSNPTVNFVNQPTQEFDNRGNFDFTLGGNLPHQHGSTHIEHHEVEQNPTEHTNFGVSYDSSTTSAPVAIGGSSGGGGSFNVGFSTSGSVTPSTESTVEQRFNENTPQVHQTYGVPH